jgi:hypothetical protein
MHHARPDAVRSACSPELDEGEEHCEQSCGFAAGSVNHKTVIGSRAQELPVALDGIVVADPAVAPVIADNSGARRAGHGRAAVSASERSLGVLGMSTEQRGETCSRSSPLGVLTEETHHQRDKGVEYVRPARGRPVEV